MRNEPVFQAAKYMVFGKCARLWKFSNAAAFFSELVHKLPGDLFVF